MSMLKQYRHRGEIKTIPYSPSSPPPSPELKILLDLSASPRFYEHLQKDHSSVVNLKHPKTDHERLKEADAQRKLFSAQEARLQRQIDQLVSDQEARDRARERELKEQLRYEVADRFCRGLVDMLCNQIDKLPDLLSDLASELHRPALRYAPNAFVLLTYHHHHNDNTLPDIFYEFSERVHRLNVSTLEDVTPRARTILTELDTFMSGPCGDDLHLLIHLWAVRAGLGSTRNLLAHLVPDSAFASEMLHEFISDPEQQALMERILPSLIEDVGVSENIKYFVY